METMAISEFKARCLAVMDQVRKTGKPLLVTRFGKPVARIEPPREKGDRSWIGCMEGEVEFLEDITGPLSNPGEWEALR